MRFGSAGIGDGEFNSPHDLAINGSDKIFVSDTHNYRVQVFAPNNPPIAEDQEIKIKNKEIQKTLSASDPDDDTFTFSIESGPSHGTISNFNPATGTLIYKSNKNFLGTDAFTFQATDTNGAISNIATVSILISNKPSITISLGNILSSLASN